MPDPDIDKVTRQNFLAARAFFCSLSSLLHDTEDLLIEHDWSKVSKSLFGDIKGCDGLEWLPQYVSSAFTNTKCQHHLLYVGVILDEIHDRRIQMDRALISAGRYVKGRDDTSTNWDGWKGWHCKAHILSGNLDADGSIRKSSPDEWRSGIQRDVPGGAIAIASLALPLSHATTRQDLKIKVIDPILDYHFKY